ncbi:MAG TPA: hypothetical protein VF885_12695 [Arthrobacter sp.]
MSPRAYDLIGDVTSPAEIFPRLEALEKMVESLRARGLIDAATDTLHLLEEAKAFDSAMRARSGRLRGLWKAIEVAHTPSAQSKRGVAEAAVAYRAVLEQGTRRG